MQHEIKLEGQVDPNVDPVFMDTQAIGRVFNNLISNALRHTPARGQVKVGARRTGSGVEVTVSDTGEGIRPQDIPHIFERFYRGDARGPATAAPAAQGWDFAIARGIVHAHGGDIQVESKLGQGTRFTFRIP